jgi:hypothetical protein
MGRLLVFEFVRSGTHLLYITLWFIGVCALHAFDGRGVLAVGPSALESGLGMRLGQI